MNMFLDSASYIHHDQPHHEDDHTQQSVLTPSDSERPRIILRTPSKSNPTIDTPHLMMSQDDTHPAFSRVLSSLFDPSSMTQAIQPSLTSSASSGALLAEAQQAPPLRKTSSAVDWSIGLNDISRKTSFQQHISDWSSHLLDSGRKQSFGNLGVFVQPSPDTNNLIVPGPLRKSSSAIIPHTPIAEETNKAESFRLREINEKALQGGLVMSTATADRQQMIPKAQSGAVNPFVQHLPSSTAAVVSAPSATPVNSLDPTTQQQKSGGMLGNMFKTGFFARPVVRSDEENYRYMMALDR